MVNNKNESPEISALKTAGIFGGIGALAIASFANPFVWAGLAIGTYRVGQAAYKRAKVKAASKGHDDLFI